MRKKVVKMNAQMKNPYPRVSIEHILNFSSRVAS